MEFDYVRVNLDEIDYVTKISLNLIMVCFLYNSSCHYYMRS
jgi:hypothetical protein